MKLKTIISVAAAACLLLLPSCNYKQDLQGLKLSVEALKAKLVSMNENIAALSELVAAATAEERVTKIETVVENGREVGTKFYFEHRAPIIIRNGDKGDSGKDGKDGKDGITPSITIKQGEDGIWYWTLNGEWLLDDDGNRLKVVGNDGVVPTIKVEDNKWWISYDGEHWTELGDVASTEEISPIRDMWFGDEYLYISLRSGSAIYLSRYIAFTVNFPDGQEFSMEPNDFKEVKGEINGEDGYVSVYILKSGKLSIGYWTQSRGNQQQTIIIQIYTDDDFDGGVLDLYIQKGYKMYYKKITINKK